jgi:protein required for attachment to host cells
MHVPHETWVVVADGERYLLLENAGDAEILDLRVLQQVEMENPPTHEQGSDRPGRFRDAGQGRSAVQETDWHELAKERFASGLAEELRKWALDGKFDNLVLVADPRTLGRLRAELHVEVERALAGELAKDLTGHSIDAIEAALLSAQA